MISFEGKTVLVTGSSRGIGAGIARLFAQHGAQVAVHGRDTEALSAVQADIERAGGRTLRAVADVTRFAELEAMRRTIEAELGPVDVLVANAGGSFTMPGPLEAADEAGWRRRGTIITISSSAGHRPHPGAPIPYAAAKAGIEMPTRTLATQTGPYGIRVNCIAPGTILTERNRQRIPEAQQRALVEAHPLRRLGTSDDVARTALFLASEDASWITGAVVDVAGGAFA